MYITDNDKRKSSRCKSNNYNNKNKLHELKMIKRRKSRSINKARSKNIKVYLQEILKIK